MPILKVVGSKAGIKKTIDYVKSHEKTTENLISGINCNSETATVEMLETKQNFGKESGRQCMHLVQSFNPHTCNKTAEEIHQIGKEFAEKQFAGYEVLIATHKDKLHIHNHIIINSVNLETGKKIHTSKRDLQEMKNSSDEVALKYGVAIEQKEKLNRAKINTYNHDKYKIVEQAMNQKTKKSFLIEMKTAIDEVRKKAENKNEFIFLLSEKNIKTEWKNENKYIVFTDETGHKARDKNLSKTFNANINKQSLVADFERNHKEMEEAKAPEEILKKEFAKKIGVMFGNYNLNADVMVMNEDIKAYGIEKVKTMLEMAEQRKGNGNRNLAFYYDDVRREEKKEVIKQQELKQEQKPQQQQKQKNEQQTQQKQKKENGWGMGY
jgi:hypothetical protein